MDDIRNQNQIIRKDARGCFVESLMHLKYAGSILFLLHMILTVRRVSVKQIIYLSTLQQMNFLSCAERLNAVSFAICCRIRKKVEIKLHFISALEVLLQKSWQSKAALEKME